MDEVAKFGEEFAMFKCWISQNWWISYSENFQQTSEIFGKVHKISRNVDLRRTFEENSENLQITSENRQQNRVGNAIRKKNVLSPHTMYYVIRNNEEAWRKNQQDSPERNSLWIQAPRWWGIGRKKRRERRETRRDEISLRSLAIWYLIFSSLAISSLVTGYRNP